jgi:radical SAM protein with 4Fe4S-binding SPASM domain
MFGNITILQHYAYDHYSSLFNVETGLSIRKEDAGYPEPFWASHGPELLDISITNYCTESCRICYRNSNQNGKHMDINDLEIILRQAKDMGVRQIALGGGNPNQHPDFIKILELIRQKYNIVPSYTTNGIGLSDDIINATQKNCGVVAVSISEFTSEKYRTIQKLITNNIKTNIHFVITSETIDYAIQILSNRVELPRNLNALIFLTYKPVGYYKSLGLKPDAGKVEDFLKLVENKNIPYKIGFDSCFVSTIARYTHFDPAFYDYCEAGRFSAFIDENLNMYPCSFMVETPYKESLTSHKMLSVWQKSKVFIDFRNKLRLHKCHCDFWSTCHGGCPLFDINCCHVLNTNRSM